MKKLLPFVFSIICTCLYAQQDAIYYVSLNRAVQLGQFDGVRSIEELKKNGNFGLGSSDKIGAELVLLNDTAYMIPAEGNVKIMPPGTMLPFGATKFFSPEKVVKLDDALTLEQLEKFLNKLLNTNAFAAIKISGRFKDISYICYLPQEKPYGNIKDAARKTFNEKDLSGDIVGFFTPKSALVLNNPNYHFHFINSSRTGGGHVQDLTLDSITIEVDYANELKVALPSIEKLENIDLNKPLETD